MAEKKTQKKPRIKQPTNPYIQLLPNGNGRPKKTLTPKGWELVEKLAQFMATDEEIATALSDTKLSDTNEKITVDTLTNDENRETFSEHKEKGMNMGRTSLRSWQFASAKKGNVTMQIWLGKQYLGQTEKQETSIENDREIVINIEGATAKEAKNDED